jgi:hypothetical protein
MPKNKNYAVNAKNLRQAMLDGLHEVTTIKALSKSMLEQYPDMKCSINNVNYHMSYLIDEGYVKKIGQITINSSRAFTYKALFHDYKLPASFAKNKTEEVKPESNHRVKIDGTIPGARVFKLSETHHHARMPHKQRSAWIGSTMGTMAY